MSTMESLMNTEPDTGAAVDSAVDPGSEPAESSREAERAEAKGGRRNPLVITGAVLVAVAAVAAAVFGVLWYTAAHSDSARYSQLRDQALQAAEQGSINLTTLDYRHVQDDVALWKQSSTGALNQTFAAANLIPDLTKRVQQAKSVAKGTVIEGVITDLDEHAGKATALVYMRVDVTANGGKPSVKFMPLEWNLTLTGSGWKLSGVPGSSTGQ
jgi:Mce-associated membrane protein